MYDSFHSGIEGYCKMAAKMLDVPDKISGWLPFCKDILPDRTKANITRVWTSSNERGGRGCRLSTFEDNWLQYPRDTYEYEAECLANHEQPADGFRTINDDTYISNLTSCKNAEARKQAVRRRYEHDALALCVNSMVDKAKSYDGSQIGLISLLHVDDFPVTSVVAPTWKSSSTSAASTLSTTSKFLLS